MDRLTSMAAFVAIVEEGSLTAAAQRMKLSSPMIGKHLKALEVHLSASLLMRSTRRLSLTEFGHSYYEQCKTILEQVRLADENAEILQQAPIGKVKISAPVSFGTNRFAPELAEYMLTYPDINIELILNDRLVDLIGEGFDIVIRIGHLSDSELIARALGGYAMMIAASPDYLQQYGIPKSPDDLHQHKCLGFSHWRHRGGWYLGRKELDSLALPTHRFECNHGPALRMVALKGIGLVMQPRIILQDDVRAGRLISLLEEFIPKPLPIHVLFAKERQQLPKIRTLIDFIVERFGNTIE